MRNLFLGPCNVNLRAAHCVALCVAVSSVIAVAAGSETPPTALSRLAQTGEVSCRPSLPYFCGNLHVACAGRTSIETFSFRLRATRTHGGIETDPEHEPLRKPYENGPVEWDGEGTYVILRPTAENGYIKLLADDTYSFRHYTQQGAVMSTGRCR